MQVIGSSVDTSTDDYIENSKFHLALKSELLNKLENVSLGGDEKARKKHLDRGKFLARQRIEKILDEGSTFLELSPLAADKVYEQDVPSAGVVTGIGRVHGIVCLLLMMQQLREEHIFL